MNPVNADNVSQGRVQAFLRLHSPGMAFLLARRSPPQCQHRVARAGRGRRSRRCVGLLTPGQSGALGAVGDAEGP